LRQSVQLERQLIARLKTASIRFTDAQVERIWAIVSAHQAGLSIRKIAGATGLSSSRIHQLLSAPEAKEIGHDGIEFAEYLRADVKSCGRVARSFKQGT
jgi:hypothetical protein